MQTESVMVACGIERDTDAALIARCFREIRGLPGVAVQGLGGRFNVFADVAADIDGGELRRLLAYGEGARDILRAAAGGLDNAEQKPERPK
jgi:hypothetical protein